VKIGLMNDLSYGRAILAGQSLGLRQGPFCCQPQLRHSSSTLPRPESLAPPLRHVYYVVPQWWYALAGIQQMYGHHVPLL
jgi:hypothetical protein